MSTTPQYGNEYVIKPPGRLSLNLKELWQYRELFYFFTWRDIKVKYKQTVLGFLWAVIQPLAMMLVFVLFFSKALNIPTDNIPAPVFYFSGLLYWKLFTTSVSGAGNSMVGNANIIKKIYFPRLIIPMSSVLVAVFDFLMAFIVFAGILTYYEFSMAGFKVEYLKAVVFLPAALILSIITSFGMGTVLAALNVKYRDFRYVIPFLVQFLIFVTPVIYPISAVDDYPWAQFMISLNPMTGAVNMARAPFTTLELDPIFTAISCISAVCFFIMGVLVFRKTEAYFADVA